MNFGHVAFHHQSLGTDKGAFLGLLQQLTVHQQHSLDAITPISPGSLIGQQTSHRTAITFVRVLQSLQSYQHVQFRNQCSHFSFAQGIGLSSTTQASEVLDVSHRVRAFIRTSGQHEAHVVNLVQEVLAQLWG